MSLDKHDINNYFLNSYKIIHIFLLIIIIESLGYVTFHFFLPLQGDSVINLKASAE